MAAPRAQRAVRKLWDVFRAHADALGGGSGRAERYNGREAPAEMRKWRGAATREKTLYAGAKGEDGERHASLPTEEEAEAVLDQDMVTHENTARRVEVHERREWQRERLEREGDTRRVLPGSGVHEYMRLDGENDGRVWREGWSDYETDDGWKEDSVARLMMRDLMWEDGRLAALRDATGVDVAMDAGERKVLAESNGKENAAAGRVAACLHMRQHFTDAWATDGSKAKVRLGRRVETRVACGATEGALPTEAEWLGEPADSRMRRSLGMGMRGMRLPANLEVVDAELVGVLMALRATVAKGGAAQRRVLIMSDSLTALEMMEAAWRKGVRWQGEGAGRAPLLHAINTERERLGLVVMMWVPAHAGVAANAAADAVAKAHLRDEEEVDVVHMLRGYLPEGRFLRVARGEKGGGAVMFGGGYEATKVAVGWAIQEAEARRAGSTAVDRGRLGPEWEPREEWRWTGVWERTGARTAGQGGRPEEAGAETEAGGAGTDLSELAERCEEELMRRRRKKKGRGGGATVEEVREDAPRCGVAMAARRGRLWEWCDAAQGCAACCSKARGWGWTAEEKWRSWTGRTPAKADMWHVLCGECEGVGSEEREGGRGEIRASLAGARKLVMKRQRAKGADARAYAGVQSMIEAAQKGLAKGKHGRATTREREALRRWLAGELPLVGEEGDAGVLKQLEREVAGAVRRGQAAAAGLRAAWSEAGRVERARRREREGGKEGRLWRGVGWDKWAQYGAGGGEQAASMRVAGKAEARMWRDTVGRGMEQRQGWTIAGALIEYKRRQEVGRERAAQEKREEARAGAARTEVLVVRVVAGAGASAVHLVRADDEQEMRKRAWTTQHTGRDGMQALLEAMDTAREILMVTDGAGAAEEVRGAYAGDEERASAHQRKTVDAGHEVQRAVGHRVDLQEWLRWNRTRGSGVAASEIRRWAMEGACEWAALQCTRDARAVALVACSSEARLPGMHATRAMAAGARLLGKGRKRAAEDAEGAGERQARAYRGDAAAVGVSTTVAAAAEMGESRKRGRREDIDVNSYDETKRREKRRRVVPYMDKAGSAPRGGRKRDMICMGIAAQLRVEQATQKKRRG